MKQCTRSRTIFWTRPGISVQASIITLISCTTKRLDMVRYSITMDNSLTENIDKSCEKKKISRSDWINEACTTYLGRSEVLSSIGAPLLPLAGTISCSADHNMQDYETTYRDFRIDVPEY